MSRGHRIHLDAPASLHACNVFANCSLGAGRSASLTLARRTLEGTSARAKKILPKNQQPRNKERTFFISLSSQWGIRTIWAYEPHWWRYRTLSPDAFFLCIKYQLWEEYFALVPLLAVTKANAFTPPSRTRGKKVRKNLHGNFAKACSFASSWESTEFVILGVAQISADRVAKMNRT